MIRRLLRPFWVRWIVLPLLLLLAAHTGWTLALKWQFERRLAALRAAGAPVELGDLRRPKIPDEDNAAALWEEAHKWYEEHLEPAPDKLDWGEDTWFEEDHAAISAWLEGGDPYVDLLARAAAKPDMWQDLDWEAGIAMEVRALPQMQDATTFLQHRVRLAERATPEVLRELATILDLAPKLEGSCLILVLVRWTVQRVAADSLETLATKAGFDAREARLLLDPRFAGSDDPNDLRKAIQGERVFALSVSRRWIGGEGPIRIAKEAEALTLDEASPDPGEHAFADRVWASWLARPLAYRDALRLLDLAEKGLVLVDVPTRAALPASEALRDEYRKGVPNLFSHLWADVPRKAVQQRQLHQARMRVARVGLALLELRQTTGAWPESLDAVVPLVGEEWIEDPYTGERLQYEPGVRLEAAVPVPDAFKDMPEEYEIVWRFGN